MSRAKSRKWFGWNRGWKEDPSDADWLDDNIYPPEEVDYKPGKKPKLEKGPKL